MRVGSADDPVETGAGCCTRSVRSTPAFSKEWCGATLVIAILLGGCQAPRAGTDNADQTQVSGTQAFVEQCIGAQAVDLAPEFVGLTEAELRARITTEALRRVVGRDGICSDRNDDRNRKRVNVIIEDGRVAWAGRF